MAGSNRHLMGISKTTRSPFCGSQNLVFNHSECLCVRLLPWTADEAVGSDGSSAHCELKQDGSPVTQIEDPVSFRAHLSPLVSSICKRKMLSRESSSSDILSELMPKRAWGKSSGEDGVGLTALSLHWRSGVPGPGLSFLLKVGRFRIIKIVSLSPSLSRSRIAFWALASSIAIRSATDIFCLSWGRITTSLVPRLPRHFALFFSSFTAEWRVIAS